MRSRCALEKSIDYNVFSSPWTGLAAMILIQASTDLAACGGRWAIRRDGDVIKKGEIVRFMRSRWAWYLATACGLEDAEIRRRGVLTWGT